MFNTEVTTCYSPITLLRCYGKVLSPFLLRYYAIMARSVLSPSFSLDYYGITARYFTLLFYWHQSYRKSKCFVLLSCYTITARYSTLLIGIKATVKTSVSFVSHYCAITARYFTLLSYWHQSYCKSKCCILTTLLWKGTLLFFLIGIKATVKASVSSF